MSKRYNEKRAKQAEFALNKELESGYGRVDADENAKLDARDAAMGKGEAELFERKMTKEEKKAAVRLRRMNPAASVSTARLTHHVFLPHFLSIFYRPKRLVKKRKRPRGPKRAKVAMKKLTMAMSRAALNPSSTCKCST